MNQEQTLTQEELKQLQDLKNTVQSLTVALGEIELQKIKLDIDKDAIKQSLKSLAEQEQSISKTLVEKYGTVSIDIETGAISKIGA